MRHFLSSLKEQARKSRVNLSLKEQHCLAKFLDIDNDCLIKRDFLSQELEKVFRILDQGQVEALHLLEKDDRKYHRHFEVLKRGLSISTEEEDLYAKLLRILREQLIEPAKWFESLGSFMIEEFGRLEVDSHNRRIFLDKETFGLFLENKWGHKIPGKTVREVLKCLQQRQSQSMKNLDDGMFFGGAKEKVNVIELANRLEVLLRYQQKSQLAGFRMSVFVVFLRSEEIGPREYFARNGVGNLSKKIELFQFHLLNSTHLGFKLEDSDGEFLKLDVEQRNRVKFLDFVKKLEHLQEQIPNGRGGQNSQVIREKNELMTQSNSSQATESRRKIPRKSSQLIPEPKNKSKLILEKENEDDRAKTGKSGTRIRKPKSGKNPKTRKGKKNPRKNGGKSQIKYEYKESKSNNSRKKPLGFDKGHRIYLFFG